MVPLDGGLVLRVATPADVGQIGELLAARGEANDAEDLELVVGDPDAGFGGTAVVVDGARVVSTLTLLDETVDVDAVSLPAGQVELVATDREYEGRGLVRALMEWLHGESARRGHLVELVVGIPYFYRQLGFEYGLPLARDLPVVGPLPDGAEELLVRPATLDDVAAMAALQDAAQRASQVRMPHSAACWRWLVARAGSQQWVVADQRRCGRGDRADRRGRAPRRACGVDRSGRAGAAAACHGPGGRGSEVKERPGTLAGDAVRPYLGSGGKAEWCYLRLPDPVVVLEALRPVLAARLAAAGWTESCEMLVSGYRWHVRFAVSSAGVGPMQGGRAEQAPVSKGGSGVPPDAFPSLVFGPYGAREMEERVPDLHLGRQREVMSVLFPPQQADLLTFYLP